MKKEDSYDILNSIGHRSGMTVPDGYFRNFNAEMLSRLPEKPVDAVASDSNILPAPRRFWQAVRPYAYMVAMFCGVWLMMWIFNDVISRSNPSLSDNPVIAGILGSDSFYEYYDSSVSEYDLLEDLYNDGVDTADFDFLTD